MTSAGWNVPSTVTTPSAHDALDAGAHELDVGLLQAREPRAVVLEHPLRRRRVVGHRPWPRAGRVVAELRRASSAPNELAASRRSPALIASGRRRRSRDRSRLRSMVSPDARVEREEAEPPAVERQVAHRPALAVGHLPVVVGVREHPLRGALEHGELLDLVGDRRRDLEAAGAGADEREARAVGSRPSGPSAAEWNDGPAKSSMPGMSGSCGRFSAPTALMTARASSVSVVAVGVARRRPTSAASSSSNVARGDLGVEPAVRVEVVLRRSRARSSRAARAAARSTRSSGRPARTSSSRSGCRCRPGRRGSGCPTTCRRDRRSSR